MEGPEIGSAQSLLAGAIAGYLSINLAAICAGIQFGLQPALFHDGTGLPLYCPYSLRQAVPSMAISHLIVGGPAEAVLTSASLGLTKAITNGIPVLADVRAAVGRFWYALAALVLLSPLGLLAAGTAWGEWGLGDLAKTRGRVPVGLESLAGAWRHAPFNG